MLTLSLSKMADRLDCHVDSTCECVDGLEHLSADILDYHVTEQDVDARPENDDRQPNFKHLFEKDHLKLIGTLLDPLLVKEQVVLVLDFRDL